MPKANVKDFLFENTNSMFFVDRLQEVFRIDVKTDLLPIPTEA
jgi:hypothetical protein